MIVENLGNIHKLNKTSWGDMSATLLYLTVERIKVPALTLGLVFRNFLKESNLDCRGLKLQKKFLNSR
ncbi:MAG: hypothetical protein ACPLRT_07650 [Thermoproteota archaeon]